MARAAHPAPAKQQAIYIGKEGYPTLAFNVSVLNSREIVHVAPWQPGRQNDQTQGERDPLFRRLREGTLHPEITYKLYTADGKFAVHRGLYAIVDGGYHEWPCLVSPMKMVSADDAAMWTKRLESVRKNVECTFGILKKRFR